MRFIVERGIIAFFVGFFFGFSSCTHLPFDSGVSAAEGNDNTLVLIAPDQPPLLGYAFLRLRDGANPTEIVTLKIPKSKCKHDSCARIQVIKPDGSFGYTAGIPEGKDTHLISVSNLTGTMESVAAWMDGEYRVLVRLYYLGQDNSEHEVLMKAFIRINVLTADYVPVGCNDPAIAWESKATPGCEAQWTTKLRGVLCGQCYKL